MATTAELVTILLEQFKGWNADGPRGVLHYIDAAHKLFRQVECEQTVYYDETTGNLPLLTTTAGTYSYSLPANCWKLAAVLVESGVTGSLLDSYSNADYGIRTAVSKKIEPVTISGVDYLRIVNVRSWPSTESAVARVMFTDDPGDTTTVYNIKYYKKPADITSDTIPIEIEPPWDEMFFVPAVCKLIEGIEHGNYAEARMEILKVWLPQYIKKLNGGEQGFDQDTENRGY